MNENTKHFLLLAVLPLLAAPFLGGCITTRTASFQGNSYDAVFKSAVKGLCADRRLLVYNADKANGTISVQGRGLIASPPDTTITINGANGQETPSTTITMPGMNNPWPDAIVDMIRKGLPEGEAKPAATSKEDLSLEKQKLELEKEKLQLEKEKFEFEKKHHRKKSSN